MNWDGNLREFVELALGIDVEIGKEFDEALDSVPQSDVWSIYSSIQDGLKKIVDEHPVTNRNRWGIAEKKLKRVREWMHQRVDHPQGPR